MLWCDKATFWQGDYALTADLQIAAGKVTAVIGPSGAGKSTLLGGIAGFHPQKAGRLLWQDRDITSVTPDKRPVSMLFQDNNLFPHLTVMQNVALACGPQLRPVPAVRQRVEAMLEQVGLSDRAEARFRIRGENGEWRWIKSKTTCLVTCYGT